MKSNSCLNFCHSSTWSSSLPPRPSAAFNGQGAAAALFRSLLVYPTRMGIKIGLPQGVMLGIIQMMLFGGYAACFLFGGWLAYKGEITGGVVMNVLFATLIGGFSIAQAAPYLVYFGQAQSAGAKVRSEECVPTREQEPRHASDASDDSVDHQLV